MNFEWINPAEAAQISAERVVLFGAGRGTEELLCYLQERAPEREIVAIVDNDESLWGRSLCGHEILSPEELKKEAFGQIVVTSISGREAIARQLEAMGFACPRDYLLVGHYPSAYLTNFALIMTELNGRFTMEGSRCLHVGPGGFLGFEALLHCFGASHVASIDKFTFGIRFPEITGSYEDYLRIEDFLHRYPCGPGPRSRAFHRFRTLFIQRGDRTYIDPRKITYACPMDICELVFPDESFDLVFSFAVLEHAYSPGKAATELARVLRPGGMTVHTIVTQDHRSFTSIEGFTPFSFRSYSAEEWDRISKKRFYQNRELPVEWKRLFEKSGLTVMNYLVGREFQMDEATANAFHPDFERFSRKELAELNCTIVAQKEAT